MEVYREERPLERPPAVAARRLFDDAERRERSVVHAGLLRTRLRVHEKDGTVVTAVEVRGIAVLTALSVFLAGVSLVYSSLRIPALWLCTLSVLASLSHLLPGIAVSPEFGRVTERRISLVTAPAYVAAIGLLWASLRPAVGPVASILCGSVLAVGCGSYAVAAGVRTASVSTLWLAVAGLLPAVATVSNLSVAIALFETTADTNTGTALAGTAVFAALSSVLVVAYCWLVYENVSEATFEPLSSPLRGVALCGYLLVVVGLCLAVIALVSRLATAWSWAGVALLCLPLAIPVGGWLYHAAETGLTRLLMLRVTTRHTVAETTLYVLDSERALVRTLPILGAVLVSRAVIETLDGDELTAVLAHERHHLRPRDRALLVAATVASLPVGRNAVVAFLDYPARERAADEYAAAVSGPDALVRALRRLETLQSPRTPTPHPLSTPYALLYGATPDAATHPSINERIAAVTR